MEPFTQEVAACGVYIILGGGIQSLFLFAEHDEVQPRHSRLRPVSGGRSVRNCDAEKWAAALEAAGIRESMMPGKIFRGTLRRRRVGTLSYVSQNNLHVSLFSGD